LIDGLTAGVSVRSVDGAGFGPSVLKTSAVDQGRFVPSEVKTILPVDRGRARCNPVAGSLIISRMNTPAMVGDVGYVDKTYPNLYLPDRLWLARSKRGARTDMRWLTYFLASEPGAALLHGLASGTSMSMQSIPKDRVLALKIDAPEADEQRAIGDALEDVERLIATLQRLIAKKQAVKHGMMQELLTGRRRLPGHSAPWVEASLGSIGRCIRGVTYEPDADLSSGDRSFTVRLLRSNNVKDGQIDRQGLQFVDERRVSPAQVLASGDIVICMANGSRVLVGKAALFEPKKGEPRYTFGAFMGAFRTDQSLANPRFVAELMRTHVFRNWLDVLLSGSSINNLRPGDIEGFSAWLPGLTEQDAIAEVLGDADREIDYLRERLARVRGIKQGMMQELLTGRTRLPVSDEVAA
jgi:type I restriction enzyme S subunit